MPEPPEEPPAIIPPPLTEPTPVVYIPPPLPALPSTFDMLASALDALSLVRPAEIINPNTPASSVPVSSSAKLVQAEIDEGIGYMREVEIGRRRTMYVALKCLRTWQILAEDGNKWKTLFGTKRTPVRL